MALKNLIDLYNIFRENKSIAWLQDGTFLKIKQMIEVKEFQFLTNDDTNANLNKS